MRTRTRVPALLAATAALTLAAACSSGPAAKPGTSGKPAPSASATKARTSYDPPTAFASPDGASLPADALAGKITVGGQLRARPAVALKDQVGYVGALDSITAVDLNTSKILGTVKSKNPLGQQSIDLYGVSSNSAPVLAPIGGHTLALSAFATVQAGSGTTANHGVVELAAMDTANQTAAWQVSLETPDWASDPSYINKLTANLFAVHGTTGLVQLGAGSDHSELYAVNLTTQQVIWKQDGYSADQSNDTQVVATAPQPDNPTFEARLVGLSLADGKQLWEMDRLSSMHTSAAGPHLLLLAAYASWDGSGSLPSMKHGSGLLDVATGKMISVDTSLVQPNQSAVCQYDERSVVVCANNDSASDPQVTAYDPATGKQLWALPDATTHRVGPTVNTVWHGLVYGTVLDSNRKTHPVLLDALTGADRQTTATMSPLLVNNYFGLMLDTDGKTLVAYGATS